MQLRFSYEESFLSIHDFNNGKQIMEPDSSQIKKYLKLNKVKDLKSELKCYGF